MLHIRTPKTRRGKIFAGALGFLVAFALGAVAAFIARAPIQGGAQSTPFEVTWQSSPTPPSVVASSDMACDVSIPGTTGVGDLQFNVTSAYPGGTCTVEATATLRSSAAEDGRIIGLDLTVPEGWTADLRATDCDVALVRSTPKTVRFTVTMGATAAPGTSTTFSGDGLLVRPLSSNAAPQC